MSALAVQSLQSVSQAIAISANPKALRPISETAPIVSKEDIDWAQKLDKKMQFGWIPNEVDQAKYNTIVANLTAVRDGGGYVYEDTTSFSNNPRGIASIGSIIGRTLSGGYIGYQYGDDVSRITQTTYQNVKQGVVGGNWGEAGKGLVVGIKQAGAISLKAGAISSAINASTSIAANIFETISGRQTGQEGIGNVVSDTVGGFLSGVGATAFSGLSTLGISVAGVGGIPLMIAGVAGGAVGSVLIDMLYKGSGLFSLIKGRTMEALGSSAPAKKTVAEKVQATKPALN